LQPGRGFVTVDATPGGAAQNTELRLGFLSRCDLVRQVV
jgi:hypothetical protein